jgi:hypothetical protein
MDNLITKSNFTGLTALVGLDQTWNETNLDLYITAYQEIVLKRVLGESLYNDLDDNYTESSGDKWDKLVNGDEYTYNYNGNDYTIKYKGVKEMLTYMVYAYYKNDLETGTTNGGEVVSEYANSTKSPVDRKAIRSYNYGIDLIGELNNTDEIDYVEIGDLPFFVNAVSVDPLKANIVNYINYKNTDETIYPNWVFTPFYKINELGI